ncbi:MAG: GntR family transcriptional regulator [Rhodoferax sp.]|nr:GntR family transcriptional regulator [Rhodoferax sp.]
MPTPIEISDRILEAVLAKKLTAGARLGEQQLCTLFDATRAAVREALARLAVRGIVKSSARRGWYLAELTKEEAAAAFHARNVIETGLIRCARPLDKTALKRLRTHVRRQQAVLASGNVGLRSYLLGDFHVCMAEALGNSLLAETVRELTARTTLVALRYQSDEDAAHSCREHAAIVAALEAGDLALAETLVSAHLATWEDKLPMPPDLEDDALAELREALQPIE